MKFLHTSDWHIGKTLKGQPRLPEQAEVLAEIVTIAKAHSVDVVLLAGDVYDSSGPSAEAQRLVVRTLLDLAAGGAQVIVIAGNHDHPATFDAYRPLMDVAGITIVGNARRAENGGMVTFTATSTGERVNVAVLPFISQRYAIRAAQVVANSPAQNSGKYDEQVRRLIADLTAGFTPDAVNIVMSHLTVLGGLVGGGERAAQTIFEYYVPASAFPPEAHYVALGHLHRRQTLPAACPVVYSGAPLAVDFGEQDNTSVVVVGQASPGTPAKFEDVPIAAGRRLRTVTGTLAELTARAGEFGQDYLRVRLTEPARAGLREAVHDALPNTLEIRIEAQYAAQVNPAKPAGRRADLSPTQLFTDYCTDAGIDDPRLIALFNELQDELSQTPPSGP